MSYCHWIKLKTKSNSFTFSVTEFIMSEFFKKFYLSFFYVKFHALSESGVSFFENLKTHLL